MEVRLEEETTDFGQVDPKKLGGRNNVVVGPVLNGSTEFHSDLSEEEITECRQVGRPSANWPLTDDLSPTENSGLLTSQQLKPTSSVETEASHLEAPSTKGSASSFREDTSARVQPICTPPSPSTTQQHLISTRLEKQRVSSGSSGKIQRSLKPPASQTQRAPGDDRCVHCILACLFCEVLSACSLLAQCVDCGPLCETLLCCCSAGDAQCAACDATDCGTGCQSSSCLELCMECGSICFPA